MQQIRPSTRCGGMIAVIALAGLTACSNGEFNSNPVFDYGLDLMGLGEEDEAPAPQPTTSIGPPLYVGYKTIRVAIASTGSSGQSRTFVAPDGVEIAMNNGHVTQVIGLGLNLEGMYLPAESPYVTNFVQAARDETVTERTADYYVQRKIVHDTFRCALTYVPREGTKGIVNEQCRRFFGGPGFRNTYWTDEDRIVCSLQWFHPQAEQPLQFFETPEQAQTLDLNEQGC